MECKPPDSSVHGVVPARLLEWDIISFSRGSSRPRDQTHGSCISYIIGEFFTAEPPGKLPMYCCFLWASLVAQLVKDLPSMWETRVQSLGWEDPLEKGKATHSSILAWRIPWTIQSLGSKRVGHNWAPFTYPSIYWCTFGLFPPSSYYKSSCDEQLRTMFLCEHSFNVSLVNTLQ